MGRQAKSKQEKKGKALTRQKCYLSNPEKLAQKRKYDQKRDQQLCRLREKDPLIDLEDETTLSQTLRVEAILDKIHGPSAISTQAVATSVEITELGNDDSECDDRPIFRTLVSTDGPSSDEGSYFIYPN